MSRSNRLFEIIQQLRSAAVPLTATGLGAGLGVSARTIYRDIAVLQGMRVPIEGEAGIGYVMRRGYDLPPLMFSTDEIEALVVALGLLERTGDAGLLAAAAAARGKIDLVLPEAARRAMRETALLASPAGVTPPDSVDMADLRRAIRDERRLAIAYRDGAGRLTDRTVQPIALIYYVEVAVLAAWCELRRDFRHFRLDRIGAIIPGALGFGRPAAALRAEWMEGRVL